MAQRKAIMPGARTQWLRGDVVDPVWLNFLRDLHERTGGNETDKIEDIATGTTGTGGTAAENSLFFHYWLRRR